MEGDFFLSNISPIRATRKEAATRGARIAEECERRVSVVVAVIILGIKPEIRHCNDLCQLCEEPATNISSPNIPIRNWRHSRSDRLN